MPHYRHLALGLALAAALLAGSPPGRAQPSQPAAAAPHDGQHDFDSSMGAWKVHITSLKRPLSGSQLWTEYDGTHIITPIWDGRGSVGVLKVSGSEGGFEAMSPRLYDPAARQWTIRYASSRSGAMGPPLVGQFVGERGTFIGQETIDGKVVLVRNVYSAIDANRHRFEIAYSADGGLSWETNWIMNETRINAPADPLAAAVADSERPAADIALDGQRKPVELLAFAGVKPGDRVADVMPGAGYFTRLFSKAVGASGAVYAIQPKEMDAAAPKTTKSLYSFAGAPAYSNVTLWLQAANAITLPDGVDVAWTSMNYHDLHDPFLGSPDLARFNRAVFERLRPGGVYIVIDHAAAAGSGTSRTDDLHRIDPAAVMAEVTAAGFEFVGQSDVLRNPSDDHMSPAFAAALRGNTDRFAYKFRKPMR